MNNEQNRHDPLVIRRAEGVLSGLFQKAMDKVPDARPEDLARGIVEWFSKK